VVVEEHARDELAPRPGAGLRDDRLEVVSRLRRNGTWRIVLDNPLTPD
jgi:hypothetical protein